MATRTARELKLTPVECCTPVAEAKITTAQASSLAAVFKALGDPETVGAYAEALTRLFGLADEHAADQDARGSGGRVEPFPRPGGRARR